MVSLSKKKSSRLSKTSKGRNFNLGKNSNFNLKKNNNQGESSDFSWEAGFEFESELNKEDEIEREWNVNVTVGNNTLAVGNEKIKLSVDVAGVGFSVSNENGGTIGIGFGIVGIELNMEGGGELDYFNGLYTIKVEKKGCTYVKDYYIGGIYTHTEIQLIPNCDGRKPKDDWDTGPESDPEELTEDEKNGNIPPGQLPGPPDVDDSCLVWAMVSYVFYQIPLRPEEEDVGETFKSTVILTPVTPLEEINWPNVYTMRYTNITSRGTFGDYELTTRWGLRGHSRYDFGPGSYEKYIPIPGHGAFVIRGSLEYVRNFLQRESVYNLDASNYRFRYVGRIHRIVWETECPLILPPPYWPIGNYKKKMKKECCFTEDDRTRLQLVAMVTGADKKGYPVITPSSLQGFSQETVEIENTPQYLAYIHRYMDSVIGQWPVTIQIPDTDPEKPGEQKSTPRDIPNVSEILAETYGLILQEAIDRSDRRLEVGVAAEIELLKVGVFRLGYLVQAIADYLDFAEESVTKEIKLAFSPGDKDDFLKRSKRKVEVAVFNEDARKNPSLNIVLNKLLVAAQSTQQAFGIPVDPTNVAGSLIDFFKGIVGESEQDRIDKVKELLESGKLSNDNIGIQDNPKVRRPDSEEKNQT